MTADSTRCKVCGAPLWMSPVNGFKRCAFDRTHEAVYEDPPVWDDEDQELLDEATMDGAGLDDLDEEEM